MNLWVKRTGQLLLAALFLIACEDDSFLLGFKNQNKKFNVRYQEFLVGEGTILSIDSVVTDNSSGTARLLIGEDIDPIVGTIRAEAFTQFLGDQTKLTTKEGHVYKADSLVVQLQLDSYSSGLKDNGIGEFSVRRITEVSPLSYSKNEYYTMPGSGKEILVKVPNHYYAGSIVDTTGTLGKTSFERLYLDSKKKEKRISTSVTLVKLNRGDTLIATARLSDVFRDELFSVALNDANSEFSDITKFKTRFKGLAFVPSESNVILGFTPNGTYTRLKLYYHSELAGAVVDTLSRDFKFTSTSQVSFSNLNPTRSIGLPSVEPAYSGIDASNLRVVQNGNTMVTKIDLNNFYNEFADQLNEKSIVINAAELVIESVNTSEEYKAIPQLELRVMKEDDSYLNYRKIPQQDRDSLRKFWVFSDSRHYYVNSDFIQTQSFPATLNYNSNNYSGSLTLFIQNLFDNKNSNYRPRYVGLYPATSVGKTVDRSVFLKENIKLRIYYTLPNRSNL